MLAAESPSVDGHLAASTPRRRGMDCKSSNNVNKKLIQARLPFKRLNPEPKENQTPKRLCAHACPEPGVSDRENENESSAGSVCNGPPLVNGRGPLDGFLSRRHPASSDENIVIDLTADNSSSPLKRLTSPARSSTCLQTNDKDQGKDKTASPGKSISVDHTPQTHTLESTEVNKDDVKELEGNDGNQTASSSQLDITQDSESGPDEQCESENRSVLSNSSVRSSSESSPEKNDDRAPTEPKTTPKEPADQKKIKRRSLKNLQEQEERLRLRQEKERQKEEAKAAKEKKKEEARKVKEEREREKREKKEKDEKEKAERLKAKEEQRKSKLEAKLEEKRKKEDEKRLKEEEKRLKEEKDRLKAEKAEITRFLQKAKIQQAPKTLAAACGKFAPFEIKENVFLAPLCRVQCEDSVLDELDRCLLNQTDNGLQDWIGQKPRQSGPTKPRQTDALRDCIAVEGPTPDDVPDRKHYGPMKLMQFHENYRPAYWGTWSKKSLYVSPRCPLRRDKDLLDYEVDSDEEWEEEEPGESLSHSEGEDEEEGGEDDDDDGFFVPHGYLSDDEGALEEEEGGDLEKLKLRQKLKAREWDELMSTKKKMKVLEPVVRGCFWEGEGSAMQILQPYGVCMIEPLPKADNSPSQEELSQRGQRKERLLGQLLPLLHGNVNSSKVIITEFQEFCRQKTASSSPPEMSSPVKTAENIPTRIQVKRLIKDNAVYEKRSSYRRCCWHVHTEVLSRFGQEALPVPCQWAYLTTGARDETREDPQAATGSHGNSPTTPQTSCSTSSSKRKSTGSMSITKFMKKCTDTEKTDTMETDGFQADTEDDDEEDCVIISTQSAPAREGGFPMEVAPADTAALPVASAAPTVATA